MPNAKIHRPVGMAVGAVTACAMAPRGADPICRMIEGLGGLLGGYIGAALPDKFDPATCPNHRGVAHSVMTAIAGGRVSVTSLSAWQDRFRRDAAVFQTLAEAQEDGLKRFGYVLLSCLALAIAGALAGLAAGYASHLLLDAGTPRSLPLLVKGF